MADESVSFNAVLDNSSDIIQNPTFLEQDDRYHVPSAALARQKALDYLYGPSGPPVQDDAFFQKEAERRANNTYHVPSAAMARERALSLVHEQPDPNDDEYTRTARLARVALVTPGY